MNKEIKEIWWILVIAVVFIFGLMGYELLREKMPRPTRDIGGNHFRVVNHLKYKVFVDGYAQDPRLDKGDPGHKFSMVVEPNSEQTYEEKTGYMPADRYVTLRFGRGGKSIKRLRLKGNVKFSKVKDVYINADWMSGKGWKVVLQKKLKNTKVKA